MPRETTVIPPAKGWYFTSSGAHQRRTVEDGIDVTSCGPDGERYVVVWKGGDVVFKEALPGDVARRLSALLASPAPDAPDAG